MSEVDQLHDALERQSELIAALRNEIATKDKRITELESDHETSAKIIRSLNLMVEQHQARIAELEAENERLEECEKVVSDLKAQLTEEADMTMICAGCGFAIEPDIKWGRDRHAYHAKCLPADGRTYSEGCKP